MRRLTKLLVLLCLLLTACGADFFLFVSFNPGGAVGTSIVIVLSDDDEDEVTGAVLLSGTLPPGMTLHSDGTLHGTPSQSGLFEFTVELTFGDGHTEEKTIVLEIADP